MPENSLIREIKVIVENGLKDKPIVIWYDEGGTLSNVINEAVPNDINFIEYNGSYLVIREEVEESDSHLKQKWFIYIGRKRREKSWLRDYELFGECIEYNLERLLVERFGLRSNNETKKLLTGHKGSFLAQNWSEVIGLNKKDLDIELIKEGLLAATFKLSPQFDVKRAILDYLTLHDHLISELTNMDLHNIFSDKIVEYLGINCQNEGIVNPEVLASSLLLSEFVVSSDGIFEEEFSYLIPEKSKRPYAANLVKEWINNTSLNAGFFEWSEKLSSKYNINSKLSNIEKLVNVISFKEVDDALLEELITRIKVNGFASNAKLSLKISKMRKNCIWTKKGEVNYWDKIYPAALLFETILNNMETLDEVHSFDDFIRRFSAEKGWWTIDETYLIMSANGHTTLTEIKEYIIKPTSKKYGDWLDILGRRFSESVSKIEKWESKNAYSQQDFWNKNISINEDKVAVLYIDALRYDLAKNLFTNLEERDFKVSLTPMLSSLPSITEVGMAALLPKSKGELSLEVDNGKLKTLIKDSPVTLKNERINWAKKVFKDAIFLSLNEINTSTKEDLESKLHESNRIFIMDQEIDKLGTFLSEITVSSFKGLVNKIAIAVENLHNAGVKKVVIGSDHGFLLLPQEAKIDNIPLEKDLDENTIKKRRFIVGNPPLFDNFISFSYDDLGYNSKGMMEFPRSIYCIAMPGTTGIIHGGISLQENCIASIESIRQIKSEKIGIKVNLPDVISSVIFFVEIVPSYKTVTFSPRKVKIGIYDDDKLLEESDELIIFQDTVKTRLNLRAIPEEVIVQVKDTETGETLFSREISVQLDGYDDII